MDLRAAVDRQGHRLLEHFLQRMGGPAVRVRLWDGSVLEPAGDAVATAGKLEILAVSVAENGRRLDAASEQREGFAATICG